MCLMFPPKHYLTLCDLAAINRLRAVAKLGGDCDAELSWPQGCSYGPWRLHKHVRVQVGKPSPLLPAPCSALTLSDSSWLYALCRHTFQIDPELECLYGRCVVSTVHYHEALSSSLTSLGATRNYFVSFDALEEPHADRLWAEP